jgi:hypothetical protein
MTLENNLQASLSEWRPKGRETVSIALGDSPWKAQVTANRCDELSCQLWELTLARGDGETNQTLAGWASHIAGKPVGLMEQLKVLEVDNDRQEALLRSETPSKRDGKLFYHEVLLQGTRTATVRRFQGSFELGSKREQAAFVLTHEVLERLVESIIF